MESLRVENPIQQRLANALYVDAMLLADEARTYFDDLGRAERDGLAPLARVVFSCESLKVTTRLMHVIAWLLNQRAVAAGEIAARDALDPSRRLGAAPVSDAETVDAMPEEARALIVASVDLHRRVAHLDDAQDAIGPASSPVRSMLEALASSL